METITLENKKEFIRWLLKKHKLKRRESVWLLNYLLNHEMILKNVHFVEDAHFTPRAMIFSTTKDDGIPFRFYKGNLMTADAEKALHDLRLHEDDKMYIQVNFPNKEGNLQYLSVLEENQHAPINANKASKETEELVDMIVQQAENATIMKEIDKALDSGNKELFMELSSKLSYNKESKTIISSV